MTTIVAELLTIVYGQFRINPLYFTKEGGLMTLPEKLYDLRRKRGLSQEALAEKLDCSRQAISKWENGTTTPNAEMLQKYSEFFGVSIDYLVKEGMKEQTSVPPAEKENKRILGILGLLIAILGCVSLVVFAVISIFDFKAADKIAQSSMIVMDGTFIAMMVSVLFVVFGIILLIKTIKRK